MYLIFRFHCLENMRFKIVIIFTPWIRQKLPLPTSHLSVHLSFLLLHGFYLLTMTVFCLLSCNSYDASTFHGLLKFYSFGLHTFKYFRIFVFLIRFLLVQSTHPLKIWYVEIVWRIFPLYLIQGLLPHSNIGTTNVL